MATDGFDDENVEFEAADEEVRELLDRGTVIEQRKELVHRFKTVRGKFIYPVYKEADSAPRKTPDIFSDTFDRDFKEWKKDVLKLSPSTKISLYHIKETMKDFKYEETFHEKYQRRNSVKTPDPTEDSFDGEMTDQDRAKMFEKWARQLNDAIKGYRGDKVRLQEVKKHSSYLSTKGHPERPTTPDPDKSFK